MLKLITPLLLCFSLFTSQVFAQTVITENFDSGIPATWTVVDLGDATGDSWFGTTGGYQGGGANYLDGTEFVFVDSDAFGNASAMLEELISPVFDGTPYASSGLFLSFDQFYNHIGADRGIVLVGSGATWDTLDINVADDGGWNAPAAKQYDLSPFISANMQIRFVYDDGNVWAWYWAIDNFSVFSPVPDDVGVSSISAPVSGRSGTSSALTSTETVMVEVSNFSTDPVSNIPVNVMLDGALVATETLAGPVPANGSMMYTFTATLDLSAAGNYTVDAFTSLGADVIASNDSTAISVSNLPNPVLTLPYCEDFESMSMYSSQFSVIGLPGAMAWDFETDVPGEGRIRSEAGAGFANSGTQALTMDIDPSGNIAINYATATVNMSAYDVNVGNPVLLTFSYMEHGDEVSANDSVWVRGSENDPWIGIFDWNTGTGATNGVYFTELEFPLGPTLQTAGQNFSSTTQIRFGQEDNFPAASTTGSDGFTIDDIKIEQQVNDDLLVGSVSTASICGNPATYFDIEVVNRGLVAQSNVPVGVNITGAFSGSATGTLAGPIMPGDTMAVSLGPISTVSGGTVTVAGYSELVNDQIPGNDTLETMITFIPEILPIPIATGACPGDTAYAVATTQAGIVHNWFDAAGTSLGTGDSLPLGVLTADTTVFVSAEGTLANVGLQDQILGGQYTFFPDGLIFDVINGITLDSVFVYGVGTGDVQINLLDALGNTINTTTAPLLDTTGAKSVVPVGFSIPPGTGYQLTADGSTVTSMNRENGAAVYPYTSTDVIIQGAINGLGGYYYFFYDWHYRTGCESSQVAVTVSPFVTSSALASDVSCNGGSDGSASASASGGVAPYTYAWGNGETTATAVNLPAGTNDVTITDATGCAIVETVTVTEPATAVTASVVVTNEAAGNDGAIDLTPAGGTTPYTFSWDNGATTEDLTGLASGTYCVDVTDANGCVATACGTVMPPSAVGAIEGLQSIALFPNPTDGQTTLQVAFDRPLQIQLEVNNVLGQQLIQRSFNSVSRIDEVLDMSNQSDGTYFLILRSGDQVITKRLTISK